MISIVLKWKSWIAMDWRNDKFCDGIYIFFIFLVFSFCFSFSLYCKLFCDWCLGKAKLLFFWQKKNIYIYKKLNTTERLQRLGAGYLTILIRQCNKPDRQNTETKNNGKICEIVRNCWKILLGLLFCPWLISGLNIADVWEKGLWKISWWTVLLFWLHCKFWPQVLHYLQPFSFLVQISGSLC